MQKKILEKIKNKNPRDYYKRATRSVIQDKVQFSLRIPKTFAEDAGLVKSKDKFEFILVPLDNGDHKFTIEAKLIRGKNAKENIR